MPLPSEQNAFFSSRVYEPLVVGTYVESDIGRYRVVYVSPPSSTNYRGAVFLDESAQQLITANKGTDPSNIHDYLADQSMGMMGVSTQWPEAAATMRAALDYAHDNNIPLSHISATGHSLGGAHAQLQAAMFGVQAETFNAYGAATMARHLGMDVRVAEEHVINHRMYHDPVSWMAEPIGKTVDHMDYADYQRHRHAGLGLAGEVGAVLSAHGISNFWEKEHNRPAAIFDHNYMPEYMRDVQHRGVENMPPGVSPNMSLDRLAPLAANANANDIVDHLYKAMEMGDDRTFRNALDQIAHTDFSREFWAHAAERVEMQDRQLALEKQLEQTQQQLAQQQTHSHAKVLSL